MRTLPTSGVIVVIILALSASIRPAGVMSSEIASSHTVRLYVLFSASRANLPCDRVPLTRRQDIAKHVRAMLKSRLKTFEDVELSTYQERKPSPPPVDIVADAKAKNAQYAAVATVVKHRMS